MKKIPHKDLIEHTAGSYLCEFLPDDWQEMEDEKLFEFLEENACEPYEHHEGKAILEYITDAACSLGSFLTNNELAEVTY